MSTAISLRFPACDRAAIGSPGVRARTGRLTAWLSGLALLSGTFLVGPASAGIDLRVESRPIGNPIEAYVTVTNADGSPVGGLGLADFTVTVDGNPITIQPSDFSLPPSANPDKKVSIIFAMDYSPSTAGTPQATMQTAVVDFINAMRPGDYAAIIKFNGSSGASVLQQFTPISTGTDTLVNAAMLPYSGTGTNIFDAIDVALRQFVSPPPGVTLPPGPKAVVVISDGLDNASTNTRDFIIDQASSLGIPLFTIAVGAPGSTGSNVMNTLAARTGASFISAPSQAEIANAYRTIATRLDNGYLLSFESSITDCNQHTLSVAVTGQGTTETRFTRCDATTGPVTVPNVVNQTQAAATTTITAAGLVVGVVTQQSSATVSSGNVSSQNPTGGVGVAAGSAVNLVVSTGPVLEPGPVAVPNVLNQTQAAATTAINGAGLVLGTISQRSSVTVPAGSVISQSPNAGTSVAAGSAVALVVSTGPVAVPDVVNLTEAAAITALTNAGLAVGTVSTASSPTVPSGRVISQNPNAGTSVVAGSAVALVLSSGAPPPPPPSPQPSNSGGGGGGSFGFGSLALGLAALAARRRRRNSIG